jgi:hypothetical protein
LRTFRIASGRHVLHAWAEQDFDGVFETLSERRVGGLVIGTDVFFSSRNEQLAALALRHALPSVYTFRTFTAAGGLMSYGGSNADAMGLAGVSWRLYRSHSEGRQTGRSSGPAIYQNRALH